MSATRYGADESDSCPRPDVQTFSQALDVCQMSYSYVTYIVFNPFCSPTAL